MKALKEIFQLLFSRITLLKQRVKLTPLFPFFLGVFVPVFFTLTILHFQQGEYNDELGYTGDNDSVTIEQSPQTKKPLMTVKRERIKAGESLSLLLAEKGFTPQEIHSIQKELKKRFCAKNFRTGQSYETTKDSAGKLQRFSYFQDQTTTINIEKNNQTGLLVVQREIKSYETRIVSLHGTVTQSLSSSLKSSGRAKLMEAITALFASKINFRNDVTPGSKYKILFEEKWLLNEFIGTGKILAVELSLPKHTSKAYLYSYEKGKSGYFDEHGNAINHTSLFTSPCNFSHISSGFGFRIHPVTGTRQFHGGVDMAAVSGTPVRAAADGMLIFKGYKGLAGNMVTLEHSGHYYSQYLHLSRYALNTGYNRKIQQGEIIGYVGTTGRTTGPHLDFRIVHNGRPMNPLAALGSAKFRVISPAKMGNFLASINIMKAQFDNNRVLVASSPRYIPTSRRALVTI